MSTAGDEPSSSLAERAIALADEKFLAATGPGGQNVNKVASAVQLQIDIFALGLTPNAFSRLKRLAGKRLSGSGVLTITARGHRTQQANRIDARERLIALLAEAQHAPLKRKKSRLNRIGKKARLKDKKARGQIKANRSKPDW